MTKSTQQLADELATTGCNTVSNWLFSKTEERNGTKCLLESIPLLELLEVARAASRISGKRSDLKLADQIQLELKPALTNLQKKVEL